MARPKKEKSNRPDGEYEVKATIGKDFNGKLIRKSFYSKVSKANARAKAEQYKINQGICDALGEYYAEPPRMTFENWAVKWLETYKKGTVKEHTYYFTYESNLKKYIIPYFGKAHISSIRQIDIQGYFNAVRSDSGEALAESTLKKHLIILKSIFETAIDNELCSRNPVKNIKFQYANEMKKRKVYTSQQMKQVEEYAKQAGKFDVVILLNTGIRRSELLGLKCSDFDFENNTLHIQRGVVQTKGKIMIGKPKSESSDRVIPLSEDFACYMKDYMCPSEYYVISQSCEPTSPSTYARRFKRFMKSLNSETGLPALTPHELRHTYGTLLRERGADIYSIQKVLGHSDISVTAGVYVHNDIETLRKMLKI